MQNLYPQRLNEKAILAIIRDVACAIAVLHKQNPAISHKVITPDHIYFDNSGAFYRCKLLPTILFGSKDITPSNINDISTLEKLIERTINISYLPPELYNLYKMRPITDRVDIWELGILTYFLAFYTTPFENDNGTINSNYLEEGRFTFINEYMSSYSNEFLSFIKYMLIPDMKKRPSIDDVLKYMSTIARFKPSKEYLALVAEPPKAVAVKGATKTEKSTAKTEKSTTKTEKSTTKTEKTTAKTEKSTAKTERATTKTEKTTAKTDKTTTKTDKTTTKAKGEKSPRPKDPEPKTASPKVRLLLF